MAVDKGDYLVSRGTQLGVRVRTKATNKHCVMRQELVGKLFQVPDSAGGQLGFLNEHEGRSVSEERDYVGQALAKPNGPYIESTYPLGGGHACGVVVERGLVTGARRGRVISR
jgi:hypothetical protein